MSKRFLGAASVAALMAFGLAACGQESAYDDVSSGDTTQYSETEDSYPAEDETLAGQPTDQERMAQETGVPNAGVVDSSSALREGPVVAIADIRVKSEPGKGASVVIYLPRVESEEPEQVLRPSIHEAPIRKPTGETILVIEDEPDIVRGLRDALDPRIRGR